MKAATSIRLVRLHCHIFVFRRGVWTLNILRKKYADCSYQIAHVVITIESANTSWEQAQHIPPKYRGDYLFELVAKGPGYLGVGWKEARNNWFQMNPNWCFIWTKKMKSLKYSIVKNCIDSNSSVEYCGMPIEIPSIIQRRSGIHTQHHTKNIPTMTNAMAWESPVLDGRRDDPTFLSAATWQQWWTSTTALASLWGASKLWHGDSENSKALGCSNSIKPTEPLCKWLRAPTLTKMTLLPVFWSKTVRRQNDTECNLFLMQISFLLGWEEWLHTKGLRGKLC